MRLLNRTPQLVEVELAPNELEIIALGGSSRHALIMHAIEAHAEDGMPRGERAPGWDHAIRGNVLVLVPMVKL